MSEERAAGSNTASQLLERVGAAIREEFGVGGAVARSDG
jgi:hypothetical protein